MENITGDVILIGDLLPFCPLGFLERLLRKSEFPGETWLLKNEERLETQSDFSLALILELCLYDQPKNLLIPLVYPPTSYICTT